METQCIIWNPDDVESDEDEIPKIAKENGLLCSVGIQSIKDIVNNVKQQI